MADVITLLNLLVIQYIERKVRARSGIRNVVKRLQKNLSNN